MPVNGQPSHEYDDTLVARLELLWGEGFLSPGGPAEIRELLFGVSLRDKEVLDIGCGVGGIDLLLAAEHGARTVLGIDIETPLLERAEARARAAGLADKVRFQLVESGPLPFEDASFDVVFSKDAIISIPDTATLFGEVFRVLRPGGHLVVGDWYRGDDRAHPAYVRFQAAIPVSVSMETLEDSGELIVHTGFRRVRVRDRRQWYAEEAHRELEDLLGMVRQRAIEAVGEDQYREWVELRGLMCEALDAGCLRPGHLFGVKPKRLD